VLAALAHPVAVVLLGGLAVWLGTDLRREHLARLWHQKAVRWAVGIAAVIAAAALVRFVTLLQGWISMHARNPG